MEERKKKKKKKRGERRDGKREEEKDVSFSSAPLNRSPLANDDTIKETRVERFVCFE